MQTQKDINIHTTKTFPHEDGFLNVKVSAYRLGGNSHPHFSVTGETKHTGGCIHEECLKAWPEIKPIIDLHLSNADDGEPMHAEANGYYWLAGVVGGLGEQYHGGSGSDGRTPDKCLSILANHLRITQDEAKAIADKVKDAYYDAEIKAIDNVKIEPTLNRSPQGMEPVRKAASIAARNVFHDYVTAQGYRWQTEAEAGIKLIRELSKNGKE